MFWGIKKSHVMKAIQGFTVIGLGQQEPRQTEKNGHNQMSLAKNSKCILRSLNFKSRY